MTMLTPDPTFTEARDKARTGGEYRLEGPGYVTSYGPPVGHDGYFERNIALTRSRIEEAKQDRNQARRDGDTRRAEVLQGCIDGWHETLRGLGL